MQLVLASNNARKLTELRTMLSGLAVQLVGQAELAIAEAEEPYPSFVENALAKARHAAAASHSAAIADDSGLCVDSLGGAPGVVSAHYAPAVQASGDRETRRRAQDTANNALLLERLAGADDRAAHFVSTLVAVRSAQDPQPLVAVGRWPGRILLQGRGSQGFGYDPLMFIPALGCTVAELDAPLKNLHSHRARAMAQMLGLLREVWRL
jgi:XTP/dITP diphosphohydrolase